MKKQEEQERRLREEEEVEELKRKLAEAKALNAQQQESQRKNKQQTPKQSGKKLLLKKNRYHLITEKSRYKIFQLFRNRWFRPMKQMIRLVFFVENMMKLLTVKVSIYTIGNIVLCFSAVNAVRWLSRFQATGKKIFDELEIFRVKKFKS